MSELRERCKEFAERDDSLIILPQHVQHEMEFRVNVDALEAFVRAEAERAIQDFIHGRDKLCINCGAKEPCSLKDDPQSPCTFDPSPKELLIALRKQNRAERITGMEAASSRMTRKINALNERLAGRDDDDWLDLDAMIGTYYAALECIDAEIAKLKEGE